MDTREVPLYFSLIFSNSQIWTLDSLVNSANATSVLCHPFLPRVKIHHFQVTLKGIKNSSMFPFHNFGFKVVRLHQSEEKTCLCSNAKLQPQHLANQKIRWVQNKKSENLENSLMSLLSMLPSSSLPSSSFAIVVVVVVVVVHEQMKWMSILTVIEIFFLFSFPTNLFSSLWRDWQKQFCSHFRWSISGSLETNPIEE